jgi:hypothetical protein
MEWSLGRVVRIKTFEWKGTLRCAGAVTSCALDVSLSGLVADTGCGVLCGVYCRMINGTP